MSDRVARLRTYRLQRQRGRYGFLPMSKRDEDRFAYEVERETTPSEELEAAAIVEQMRREVAW